MAKKVITNFQTTLSQSMTDTQLTISLSSLTTFDGHLLTAADLGDSVYLAIEPGTKAMEIVKADAATISGTTLTLTYRGLPFYGDTESTVAANRFAHSAGAVVMITNVHYFYNPIFSFLSNPVAPAGFMPTNPMDLTTKQFVESIAYSGISSFYVQSSTGITVNINPGYYSLNGIVGFYAGISGQSLTDNADNYIEFLNGAISINTTAFSNDSLPLAKVTTASGAITTNTDARAFINVTDLSTDSGLGRDANGIYIDLAANPGLEIVGGKLKAKVKSGGGILIGADGLEIDPTTQPLTSYTATALEDLTAGDALAYVQANQEVLTNYCSAVYTDGNYYIESTSYKTAQTFTASKDKLGTVISYMSAYNCNAQYCSSIALYATDGTGKPTGSAIQTVNFTNKHSQTTEYDRIPYVATFTSSLTIGSKYALVFTYANVTSSYKMIARYKSDNPIANGEALYFDGSNWSPVAAGADFDIQIFEAYGSAGLVKTNKISLTPMLKLGATEIFAGICSANTAKGETATVLIDKYTTTGLTPGYKYFIDSNGLLSTTNSTIFNSSAGLALDSSNLKLKMITNSVSGGSGTFLTGSSLYSLSSAGTAPDMITFMFKPNFVGTFYYIFSSKGNTSTTTTAKMVLNSDILHTLNVADTEESVTGAVAVDFNSVIYIKQTGSWNSGIKTNYARLKNLTTFI